MVVKKKATNKLVLGSFFKTITIDGKTEQITTRTRRTLFFDNEEGFPFSKVKNVEVAINAKDSVPTNCLKYLVLLNLTDGRKILVSKVGETSKRISLKEMKNLGRKISLITGKNLKLCEE